MGTLIDPPYLGIAMEFCANGSLFDCLQAKKLPLGEKASGTTCLPLRIARDICLGMAYLQNQKDPLLHRDLKSLNVLLSKGWHAKIAVSYNLWSNSQIIIYFHRILEIVTFGTTLKFR